MSTRTFIGGLSVAAALLLGVTTSTPALAGEDAKAASSQGLELPFERYNLDNGMEVILHRDTSAPLVAVNLWYHVGSGDETPGKSGFCLLYTSPSPRDYAASRMPSSA